MPTEIERKWLLHQFPSDIVPDDMRTILQVYLYVERDINGNVISEGRVRRSYGGKTPRPDKLTVKFGNGLSRKEYEAKLIDTSFFDDISAKIGTAIKKDYRRYVYEDDSGSHYIEISMVDNSFIYAEVEFDTEELAKEFEWPWPDIVEKEVTGDPSYSMAQYWIKNHMRSIKISNADKIRAMTDEELADMFDCVQRDSFLVGRGKRRTGNYPFPSASWLGWLKQEVQG